MAATILAWQQGYGANCIITTRHTPRATGLGPPKEDQWNAYFFTKSISRPRMHDQMTDTMLNIATRRATSGAVPLPSIKGWSEGHALYVKALRQLVANKTWLWKPAHNLTDICA